MLKGASMTVSAHSGLSDNAAGAIAYITFLPAVVFLVMPPYSARSFVRFHAWQSVLLNVAAFVVNIALSVLALLPLFMGPLAFYAVIRIVWLLWFALWILCVVQAVNGKTYKLPAIGDLAEKLAG
jgi:uncharacterized membrane protein